MSSIISVANLSKTYDSGFKALKNVNLDINRGEIFALLGPNGAGKTTLISIICGIVNASTGTVLVDGHDNVKEWRTARRRSCIRTPLKPCGQPRASPGACSASRRTRR
jgi:ABC-2 type transport system ATP-binding protein